MKKSFFNKTNTISAYKVLNSLMLEIFLIFFFKQLKNYVFSFSFHLLLFIEMCEPNRRNRIIVSFK